METTKNKEILATNRKGESVKIAVSKAEHQPFKMVIKHILSSEFTEINFDTQKKIFSYIEQNFNIYLIK